MMRFLSRREKDGSSHKRDKSRDKSGDKLADKKVTSLRVHFLSFSRDCDLCSQKSLASQSVTSLSAAFPNPPVKTLPLLETFYKSVQGTKANSRPFLPSQVRPRSGDGILSLFKNEKEDPQKKADNEQSNKVRLRPSNLVEVILICFSLT